MRATLLIYGMTEERLARLRFLCIRPGIMPKKVPVEDYGQTIAALCGLEERGEDAEPQGEPFTDEMLVMCGFTNGQVDALLAAMKKARFAPVALKAVLTPTNMHWDSTQLHHELAEEHAAMSRGSRAHG